MELKPCPFCGKDAELLYYDTDGYLPKCTVCDGMVEHWFKIKEDAEKAWNKRHYDT